MILAIRCVRNDIVDSYLDGMIKRLDGLSKFAKRFSVEYKKFVDEENEYFILLRVKVFLLGILPLLIIGTGFIYLSAVFHAAWLVLVGLFFFLLGIVQTPQFWYWLMRTGLKKAGYKDKISMINYGEIMDRLYDGTSGDIRVPKN